MIFESPMRHANNSASLPGILSVRRIIIHEQQRLVGRQVADIVEPEVGLGLQSCEVGLVVVERVDGAGVSVIDNGARVDKRKWLLAHNVTDWPPYIYYAPVFPEPS